jgi:hypothetical protein
MLYNVSCEATGETTVEEKSNPLLCQRGEKECYLVVLPVSARELDTLRDSRRDA